MQQIFEENHADFPFSYSCWPESNPELIRRFSKFNENLRWDNNFELNQIANMDETPLFMNISNTKTITKISSKEVKIKTNEKKGFKYGNTMNCSWWY